MAIRLDDKYPGRVTPGDPNYPDGSIKNETVPDSSDDGTPLDQLWGNDIEGLKQAVLGEANITPNDVPDTVLNTQWLQGFKAILGVVAITLTGLRDQVGIANGHAAFLTESGRGGHFKWDSSDLSTEVTADTESGIYVAPTSDLTGASGAWVRDFYGDVDPRWFGVVADGVTDDSAAIIAADAADVGQLRFTKGDYLIESDVTFSRGCVFDNEAILSVSTAITVTFNNTLTADVYQIFDLTGTALIVLNPSYTDVGYPEWWGGLPGGGDALAGISACFVACSETKLQPADYVISATLKLNTPGHILKGSGCFYNGVAGDSTRIIVADGSSNVIQMGPDVQPGSINLFTQGMGIFDLQVSRSTDPVIASDCNGILSQYNLYCKINNVKSVESMRGIEYIGTVAHHTDKCWAFRSSAGTGGGTDYWYGYYIDGTVTIPASGGNASFYLTDSNANNTLATFVTHGFYINDKWADTFIINPEATGCSNGISVVGNSSAVFGYGETDLHIIKPTVDDFSVAGINISNTSIYGSITINGGFLAPGGAYVPTASIFINNSLCAINLVGGIQHILGPTPTMTGGLLILDSKNVTSIGNNYLECGSIPVYLSGAENCTIMDRVTNNTNVCATVGTLSASNRNKMELTYSGAAAKATVGYNLVGATNNYNELNCTGLDPNGITGGSGNKLVINGVQITATGLSGNNLASGVMA